MKIEYVLVENNTQKVVKDDTLWVMGVTCGWKLSDGKTVTARRVDKALAKKAKVGLGHITITKDHREIAIFLKNNQE